MNRTVILPSLLLSLALTGAGCGGEAISKADFITKADKICADATAELEAAAEEVGEAPSQEQIEAFASDTLVPNLQDQHDDIEALGAPEGDEDEIDAMLSALQDGIDAVEDDPSVITSPDDPFTEANELAEDYGLKECAG